MTASPPCLRPTAFHDLPGWDMDDALAAFHVFQKGAPHLVERRAELRPARPPDEALVAICRDALRASPATTLEARRFFERWFAPFEIGAGGNGGPFFTGYFEPEIEGALAPGPGFAAPILARPPDLQTLPQGESIAGPDGPLSGARIENGRAVPFPDRAAIESGALDGQGLELLWLRDRVDVFIVQVQGSARVRLRDGRVTRLRYAGRNGWPYTSIGRILIERRAIAPDTMSLEALTAWLRANPREAEDVMRRNRSYVFFARDDRLDPKDGPIGGAGLPLTAGRSIAVDRGLWSYGLPFFIDVDRPETAGGMGRWRRLMVAQDTGSAIVGPGRVDVFFGTGAEAGTLAGRQRHRGRLFVLRPRQAGTGAP